MAFEHYIRSGQRLLRCGYTTGTCAALAAKAAAEGLVRGGFPALVSLETPAGLRVEAAPVGCEHLPGGAKCGIVKDAGDDPDITNGITVFAQAEFSAEPGLTLRGGEGVGRVTGPGLDQPVGEAAINSIPRKMIADAIAPYLAEAESGLTVTVSVPGGAEIAQRTFNPHLGIEGGISILGTSGIVEPMSERALIESIELEIRQAAAKSGDLILVPGNYGADFLAEKGWSSAGIPVVRCSNFIGEALDAAARQGFARVLLVGHAGKLVKLAGGIMNTHSRAADCRTELFCAHAALCGADRALCEKIYAAATADACLALLREAGLDGAVLAGLLNAVQKHLTRRAAGAFRVGAVLFSLEYGLLGMTPEAETLLKEWNLS